MLSPAARHLSAPDCPGKVIRVLDRGKPGAGRQDRRARWKEHGARLVASYDELLTHDHGELVDGVLICAGKNGDDRPIVRDVVQRLSAAWKEGQTPRFILHLSTVSARFAQAAAEFAAARGVLYANYPLTGGPAGADAATMLILACGDPGLYERVRPVLEFLGKPRFFGEFPTAGAETKLIGHYLVFHGLLGICSGAVLQHAAQPEAASVEFFDFLNQGAGHTRQWELALRRGLADGNWDTGFYCRHGAVDALYAIQLGLDNGLMMTSLLPMFEIALLFALAVQSSVGQQAEFATQAIYQHLMGAHGQTANQLLADLVDLRNPRKSLENVLSVLPPPIRQTVALEIEGPAYFEG